MQVYVLLYTPPPLWARSERALSALTQAYEWTDGTPVKALETLPIPTSGAIKRICLRYSMRSVSNDDEVGTPP